MERPERTAALLNALWLASFAALAIYLCRLVVPTQASIRGLDSLYPLSYLLAAAICFTRVAAIRSERLIWSLFGLGILLSGSGRVYYDLALGPHDSHSYPSIGDLLTLGFYVASFGALMLMLRGRLRRFSRNLWLDAVIGVLALSAVGAALLVDAVVAKTGGDVDAVATGLAYPLADVLTLALVLGVFALSGWRPERRWLLIGVAWAVLTVVDAAYVVQLGTGIRGTAGVLDVACLVVNLLIARAAWERGDRRALRFEGWPVLGVPLAFTLIAIGLLIYGNFAALNPVAVTLAVLALGGSLIGTVSSYFEQRRLEALAKRDPLTGLCNYREFHGRLDDLVAAAEEAADEFAVVMMDIDGFKDVNDLRGHAEGDRVLREVAAAISADTREADIAARIGGDEFAVLMPASDPEGALALGKRVRQRVERLDRGIGLSFGVATWPADGPSKEMLLLRADVDMYSSKPGTQRDANGSASHRVRRDDDDAATARQMRERGAHLPATDRDVEREQLQAYAEAVRESYALGLERAQQLKQNYLATVLALASAVEAKDEYTGGHINRVHHLGLLLAREVVSGEADDPQMAYGFLLHDIGKLTVPDAILNKTGRLTDKEWELMREHPEAGVRILAPIPFLGGAIDVVRHHHERWDGTGYPAGLAGEEIPTWARIFGVVDAVDAMTSDRPYRAALPLEVAHGELEKGAGSQFDPVCVAAFMRLESDRVESLIQASSGTRTTNLSTAA